MTVISECIEIDRRVDDYVARRLPQNEASAFDNHLMVCSGCRMKVKRFREVSSVMQSAFSAAEPPPPELKAKAGTWVKSVSPESVQEYAEHCESEAQPEPRGVTAMLGSAPWWFVSLAMHVLIIALASLVSMAIEMPKGDDSVIMVTELQQRQMVKDESSDPPKKALADALVKETPATDPNSKEASDIVVPPDILAKAELGDHFETINPELPDTHSALGNPDSRSFHSVEGNTEAAGGGGMGGLGMDDLIGVGGAASKGSGGGFGGGDGTGTGVQSGSGHGSFGTRNGGGRRLMVKRHGGSQETETAVGKALEWLAYHQEADGHWDVKKFGGAGDVDAGITGIALLAFLGAGNSERIGQYKDNVKRAVAWIISQQEPDGSIGKKYKEHWHPGYAYHHAICGLALAEAAGMARVASTTEAAQKAIDYTTEKHQRGEGSERFAWRYVPKTDADASVSGWFVMQLKSAKMAGLKVDPASFEGALKFYDSIEIKKDYNGYPGGRFPYHDGGAMLNPSAIGTLCNLFLGRKADDLRGGAEYLNDNQPKWGDPNLGLGNGGGFPMYYAYYGTLTQFQMGGDYWKKWNASIKSMLVPNQHKGGDEDGSWDPIGGKDDGLGGRVYMTAMGALCLEVYYRYQLLNAH